MTTKIGRIGLWVSRRQWPEDPALIAEAAATIDDAGYGALWLGGLPGGDLTLPAAVLDASERVVVASGVLNVWTSSPDIVAAEHHRLRTEHGGRFLLGLGASHAVMVEATGERYERPLQRIGAYLDELDQADPPVPVDERVLAALGPRALDLAAARSAGAHPYLATPEHTASAREQLGAGPLLAPEQRVVVETDPVAARAVARRSLANALVLLNYRNSLRRQGFDDADFADGGSDRLVDALVAWGDLDAVQARLAEHFAAGADHVAAQVLTTGNPAELPLDAWRQLAAVVEG